MNTKTPKPPSQLLLADSPSRTSESRGPLEEEEEEDGVPSNWSMSQPSAEVTRKSSLLEVNLLSISGQTKTVHTGAAVVHSRPEPWRWDHENLAWNQLLHQAEWTKHNERVKMMDGSPRKAEPGALPGRPLETPSCLPGLSRSSRRYV